MLSLRLFRSRHRVLAGFSLVVLVAALWAQRGIVPGITPGVWLEYVLTVCAFLWLGAVSVFLASHGWRAHPERLTAP